VPDGPVYATISLPATFPPAATTVADTLNYLVHLTLPGLGNTFRLLILHYSDISSRISSFI